jgi:hypothetical protein
MATNAENLTAAIAAIYAELAAGPARPDYSLDGKSVSWSAYRTARIADAKALRELLLLEEGPTELHVVGIT